MGRSGPNGTGAHGVGGDGLTDISRATLDGYKNHQDEVHQIMIRLTQIFPVGATIMFTVEEGKPKLIHGAPDVSGQSTEMVMITRPGTFAVQGVKYTRRPDASGDATPAPSGP